MIEKVFYQSSLPRSGSALLQNILAQHPDIHVSPVSGLIELIYGARHNFSMSPEFKAQDSELMRKSFLSFCKAGMDAYVQSCTDGTKKKYFIDKNRGWGANFELLSEIRNIDKKNKDDHESPKIIFVVRDLRDIFCSLEKRYRLNPHKDMGIVNNMNLMGTTTHKRVDYWCASQSFGLAMDRLKEIFNLGLDEKIHFVKYEDLCLKPEATMDRIYAYLEIKGVDHDFDNIKRVVKEDDEIYGLIPASDSRTKLDMNKSEADKYLGKEICQWIMNYQVFEWYHRRFHYK